MKIGLFIRQFIKFGLVGMINTLVSFLFYYILFFLGCNYLLSNTIGYIASLAIGYILNRIWVFHAQKADVKRTVVKYCIVYGSSLLLNLGSMFLWVDILHITKLLAPVLTLCITIPYNYIFSRFWAFRERTC